MDTDPLNGIPFPARNYENIDPRVSNLYWHTWWYYTMASTYMPVLSDDDGEVTICIGEPGVYSWSITSGCDSRFHSKHYLSRTQILVMGSSTLSLPASLTTIESEAFSGVPMQQITLPSGVTSVGSQAFANTGLRLIYIPAGVTSIADDAFSGCEDVGFLVPSASAYAVQYAESHDIPYCVIDFVP
ncbi:MAG: hypothetical protein CW338_07885 [Clostridiales bacterium]|nr:hypothetical protein [Clostridiales bacterium]